MITKLVAQANPSRRSDACKRALTQDLPDLLQMMEQLLAARSKDRAAMQPPKMLSLRQRLRSDSTSSMMLRKWSTKSI